MRGVKAKPRKRKIEPDNKAQSKRFIKAAKELRVDESGKAFEDVLNTLVPVVRTKTNPIGGRMTEQIEYKGHTITADALQRGKGWQGSYQIDGGEIRNCGDRPLRSEAIVIAEAIGAAKRVIDGMT